MHSGLRRVATAVFAGLLAGAVLIPGAALASERELPDDVAAAFSDDALRALTETSPEEFAEHDTVIFGTAHQVFLWSRGLLDDGVTESPVVALEEWVAPIVTTDETVLGLYRVWRPVTGGQAEYAGHDADADSASGIQEMDHAATLISDPTIGGWYSLRDGEVTALNGMARIEAPEPRSLESLATTISERHNEAIRQSAEHDGLGHWTIPLVGALVVTGVVGAALFVARRSRS